MTTLKLPYVRYTRQCHTDPRVNTAVQSTLDAAIEHCIQQRFDFGFGKDLLHGHRYWITKSVK